MSDSRFTRLRSQAGAVNAMWLIVVMILWVGTLALLYFTNADVSGLEESRQQAVTEKQTLQDRFDAIFNDYKSLSDVVGYYDPANVSARADVAAIRSRLDALKTELGAALGGEGTSVSLQQAVDTLDAALASAKTKASQAQAAYEKELAARQAAEKKANDVESSYSEQVSQLQGQLRDEQQRASNQADADQRRFDELIAQQRDADAAAREAQSRLADLQAQLQRDQATAEATIKSLELRRLPQAPKQPDGQVLAVSDNNAAAWIDLGGRDGLRTGTRFDLLRRDRSGKLIERGTVEVRQVDSDMALVGLVGKPDPFDPMLPGDLVRSPYFEKDRTLHFYLLGEFPLTMSKEFVSERLKEVGAAVDDQVGTGTDVLVLGEKNLAEGDFAKPLTDTDQYRLADKLGLRIMRLDDLSRYLRY